MKRLLVVGGTLGIIGILVFAAFPNIVVAESYNNNIFLKVLDITNDGDKRIFSFDNFLGPGELLFLLSKIIFGLLVIIFSNIPR